MKQLQPMQHVIYLDKGVIILNKPSGLICQSGSRFQGTDALTFDRLRQGLKEALGMSTLPYPVHRLDKNTTGALVLAQTDLLARDLSTQFRNRTMEKTYLALVRGGQQTFSAKMGEIRNRLDYIDGNARIVSGHAGKPAATDWELVASSPIAPISLLRLRLLTGLKHQLRVHLAEVLKAPILGDTTHSRTAPMVDIPRDRIFLHSSQLSFFRYRPYGHGRRYRFGVTAPVPAKFIDICQALKIPLSDVDVKGKVYINGKEMQEAKLANLERGATRACEVLGRKAR